jgi:hypothetical protein
MKKGALIFAHNSRDIDYALMAIISGGLVKKNLKVPVSLATDISTIEWMKTSGTYEKAVEIFDQIIEVEKPTTGNQRKLHDGAQSKMVPFVNANRANACDITPYDRTLLLDSDFLIFSDRLNQYWDIDQDIMISDSIKDIYSQNRIGYLDKYVSDTGVHLMWATTVMFTKNETTKTFFDLVNYVRDNYQYFGDLFRFSTRQYRNDISFSVAKHIMDGFETDLRFSLPPILTTMDKDSLYQVSDKGKLIFLVSPMVDTNFCATAVDGLDIHVMNKHSMIRNADSLMRLI